MLNLTRAWQTEGAFAAVTWKDRRRQTRNKGKTVAINTLQVNGNRWRQSRVIKQVCMQESESGSDQKKKKKSGGHLCTDNTFQRAV